MLEVTRKLVDLLDLSPIGDDHFQGDSEDLGFPHVFGGQVLGQGLMAASRTVEGRLPHSLHAYFLRPGNHSMPIDYEVQRVRDGGSFSVRRVIARQDGKEILTGSVSFQVDEEGRLVTSESLDFEHLDLHGITVRATDAGGLGLEATFTIEVLDVERPMVGSLQVQQDGGVYFASAHTQTPERAPLTERGVIVSDQANAQSGSAVATLVHV